MVGDLRAVLRKRRYHEEQEKSCDFFPFRVMPICHGADELAGEYQFEDWSFALGVFLGFVSCIGDLGFITES